MYARVPLSFFLHDRKTPNFIPHALPPCNPLYREIVCWLGGLARNSRIRVVRLVLSHWTWLPARIAQVSPQTTSHSARRLQACLLPRPAPPLATSRTHSSNRISSVRVSVCLAHVWGRTHEDADAGDIEHADAGNIEWGFSCCCATKRCAGEHRPQDAPSIGFAEP